MVNVRLVNLSHGKCEFGKYELLYSCSMVNLRVVSLPFGTNELLPHLIPIMALALPASTYHPLIFLSEQMHALIKILNACIYCP